MKCCYCLEFMEKSFLIKDDLVSLQIAKGVVIYVEKESVMGKTKELLFK